MIDYKRVNNLLLTIEFVPKTVWFSNVRSMVSAQDWDKLRKKSYKKSNYKCEICGGIGKKHPVECHEIWKYDDKKYIQKLIRLICLCPNCHRVKHIGLAYVKGKGSLAEGHLARINNWSRKETKIYIDKQFALWERRSKFDWTIDLAWLKNKGIDYIKDR